MLHGVPPVTEERCGYLYRDRADIVEDILGYVVRLQPPFVYCGTRHVWNRIFKTLIVVLYPW